MINRNKIMLGAAAIAGVATFGASTIMAQTTNGQTFVSQLAQKLGIDQSRVQQAVDSIRTDHQANRLEKLVQQGKISEDQKNAIIAELNALKAKYNLDNLKSMSTADRKTALTNFRNDFQTWARSQNIDPSIIRMGRGFGKGRGRFMNTPAAQNQGV